MNNQSDVEKLFYQLQQKLGGNIQWYNLHPMQQQEFVNAVNVILNYAGGNQ